MTYVHVCTCAHINTIYHVHIGIVCQLLYLAWICLNFKNKVMHLGGVCNHFGGSPLTCMVCKLRERNRSLFVIVLVVCVRDSPCTLLLQLSLISPQIVRKCCCLCVMAAFSLHIQFSNYILMFKHAELFSVSKCYMNVAVVLGFFFCSSFKTLQLALNHVLNNPVGLNLIIYCILKIVSEVGRWPQRMRTHVHVHVCSCK